MPGPVPKRSDQRRRRQGASATPIVHAAASSTPSEWQPVPAWWDNIAARWYLSLQDSGQSAFYEPSDRATAFYVAESMSRSLGGERMSATLFAAVMSAMDTLLTTEGARRRARVELEQAEQTPDTSLADQMAVYRSAASQ